MASSDALWNEAARILNEDFFETGQPITGRLLMQLVKNISEALTEDPSNV